MILYGLFLYYHNREDVYLFYTLYIVCISIWALFYLGYEFIYAFQEDIYKFTMVFAYLAFYFYIRFVRSFIKTAVVLPKWDRSTKSSTGYPFDCRCRPSCLPPCYSIFTQLLPISMVSLSWTYIILIISFIIKLYRSEIQFANIIWIGTSLLILGTIGSLIRFFT